MLARLDTADPQPRTSAPAPKRVHPAPATAAGPPAAVASNDALGRQLSRAVARRAVATPSPRTGGLLQRLVTSSPDSNKTLHVLWGDAHVTDAQVPHDDVRSDPPVLIEVMEFDTESAKRKVDKVAAVNNANHSQSRLAIVIALNQKAKSQHTATNGRLTPGVTLDGYDVKTKAKTVADRMDEKHVVGACFPAVWSPTDPKPGGYTFPFLELRARTTLHRGTQDVTARLEEATAGRVVVRSMDADVSNDPLLDGRVTAGQLGSITDTYDPVVVSGGYEWDTAARDATFWGLKGKGPLMRLGGLNAKWTAIIALINAAEHARREELVQVSPSLLYWPEPNAYTSSTLRREGAEHVMETADQTKDSQMRESVYYLEEPASKGRLTAVYDRTMTTTKPVKTYFDWLRAMITAKKVPDLRAIVTEVQNIRQTHLSPNHLDDIQRWYGVRTPLSQTEVGRLEGTRQTAVANLAGAIHTELSR